MAKAGVLMHIRHLDTVAWERLVWGVPEEDSLGSLPKVVELLLDEPACEPITTIVFGCGPSTKDGLSEGEYTKRYLLEHLDGLRAFPRFSGRLDDAMFTTLRKRLEEIVVTERIERSLDEVVHASRIFTECNVTRVFQVTAASHAPRCMQLQSVARAAGLVPKTQQWFLVADDRCYEGSDPQSTVVFEPAHRGDDPIYGLSPSITDVLRNYQYGLSAEDKKALISLIGTFMAQHANMPDVRDFARQ